MYIIQSKVISPNKKVSISFFLSLKLLINYQTTIRNQFSDSSTSSREVSLCKTN